ncbi:LutC/YkgG family protein [Acidicapsa ligni]|uniref:LutC/YkgG family protein n=1 Tax=Acidicapsa ligni TaxID=542300 RepID=UPI0021DFFEFB|nr:LUD domain-containing protein [Acidicapsa ligni]
MADSDLQRSTVLASIRMSLGQAQASDAIDAEYAAISRSYKLTGELSVYALLDLFEDRLLEYGAGVYRASAAEIGATIGSILRRRGKSGLAMPAGVPMEWMAEGFTFVDATGFDAYELDKTEGILSSCTVAIAETGSLVLQNVAGQGARVLSLVPDYHLCVVFADQVVETVPEAFERLENTSTLPTTFISGPSATADIEMTRIKGVHGPRFLDVLIVV